ncbi:MAG: BatA domain-containing protein, partial [Flavisolibacter sp.]
MNYQFQYPEAFWLLALVPVFLLIYFLNHQWKKRALRKTGNPNLVKALYPDHSPLRTVFKIVMMVIAFALGCIALANPRKPDENSAEARKGIDIIIALDVSNSMKAKDIEP